MISKEKLNQLTDSMDLFELIERLGFLDKIEKRK